VWEQVLGPALAELALEMVWEQVLEWMSVVEVVPKAQWPPLANPSTLSRWALSGTSQNGLSIPFCKSGTPGSLHPQMPQNRQK
jgi:hypothetical protein